MEDVLKNLAEAKPPAPEVDRDRMERDLARIVMLPREKPARKQFVRRFAPLAVIAAVIVLAVVLLPAPPQPVQPAAPAKWWHALSRQWSLMMVGDPADPYAVVIDSKTDRWTSANQHVTVLQKDGQVSVFSLDGGNEWEAAGKPEAVPQVGGSRLVRIGPLKPAVQKTDVSGFQMSLHSQVRFDSLDSLPAEPRELRNALETVVGADDYRVGSLAIELMASNVRNDQRRAAFELLESLKGARSLGDVSVHEGRSGIGVVVPAPATFQFTGVETRLVVDPETWRPLVKKDVITSAQFGLPAQTPISEEEYLLLEQVAFEPIVPQDVPVNAPVESPIIER
ncbi:hypothetical protein [Lentzea cavernae]|uniref:Uncharacterized protein n=1 Tax=Lentzea cavernae TaxID=2020703 RepID=A0ABQ3M887_9PSEU|nr:hypothetical protein [Lentzea cavernae]GHH35584.1 hypothetical protein GCM10017774_21050 [Lentzea cavernae]